MGLGDDGCRVLVLESDGAGQLVRQRRGGRDRGNHLGGLQAGVQGLHVLVLRVGVGQARLGAQQVGLGLQRRVGRLLGRVGQHLDQLVLVGQVGVAQHHAVGDHHALLAHLHHLRELAVLKRHLHGLLADHHVVLAHGHVVQVGTGGGIELVDLQDGIDFLAGQRIGLGDAKHPVAVVVGLDQLEQTLGQQPARVGQVVQGHGQLLLAGVLLGLDGNA